VYNVRVKFSGNSVEPIFQGQYHPAKVRIGTEFGFLQLAFQQITKDPNQTLGYIIVENATLQVVSNCT
jgi:hypothetical protein